MSVLENPDIFISYSTKNKDMADAVVSELEANGLSCWYAPRNIMPGEEWVTAITKALEGCKVFLLIFTADSNESRQVMNEVAMAFNLDKSIVPFRVDDVKMTSEFEYYLTRVHWLDAVNKPNEESLPELRKYVSLIMEGESNKDLTSEINHVAEANADGENASASDTTDSNAAFDESETSDNEDSKPKKKKGKKRKVIIPLVIAIILGGGAIIAAIVVAIVFMSISGSGNRYMEKGIDAFNSEYQGTEDNALARECFQKAAKKGKEDAYYYLGMLDERDFNYASAINNYNKGITKGSDLAKLELGYLYERGIGIYPDLNTAKKYYDEALANGTVEANYYEAGYMLHGYFGSDVNIDEVIELYKKALDSEDDLIKANAYVALANISENGFDEIAPDYNAAMGYYNEAIKVYPYYRGFACDSIAYIYKNLGDEESSENYYVKALDFFEFSAEKGNAVSNYWAGLYYQYGCGVKADGERAMDYFRISADEGNTTAMCNIAQLYEYGCGNVKQDYDKAFEWYNKAVDAKSSEAMICLGDMYFNGEYGVKDDKYDFNDARYWYEEAIKNGGLEASWSLGYMYENGLGSDVDYDRAYEYYKMAADYGDSISMRYIGLLYKDAKLSEEPDYENAIKWLSLAAKTGDNYSLGVIGCMYYEGTGVNQDLTKARRFIERAVDELDADATMYYYLGYIYHLGLETTRDDEKAELYLTTAADMGSVAASAKLGEMYFTGDGVEESSSLALFYLTKVTDAGTASKEIYKILGDMYYYGNEDLAQNDYTAMAYYLQAIDMGLDDGVTYSNLGFIYSRERDFETSGMYFAKAANLTNDSWDMYNAGISFYSVERWDDALIWLGNAIDHSAAESLKAREKIRDMVKRNKVSKEDASKWLSEPEE